MSTSYPPVVVADQSRPHRIFIWSVPGTIDGRRFAVHGHLDYAPLPGQRFPRLLVIPLVGLFLLAVAVALLRRRGRAPSGRSPPTPTERMHRCDARPRPWRRRRHPRGAAEPVDHVVSAGNMPLVTARASLRSDAAAFASLEDQDRDGFAWMFANRFHAEFNVARLPAPVPARGPSVSFVRRRIDDHPSTRMRSFAK